MMFPYCLEITFLFPEMVRFSAFRFAHSWFDMVVTSLGFLSRVNAHILMPRLHAVHDAILARPTWRLYRIGYSFYWRQNFPHFTIRRLPVNCPLVTRSEDECFVC